VNKLYGDTVEQSLRAAGYAVTRFVFPHGEQSKNTETYVSLLCALAGASLTRSDIVVALGGGVVGDMAGFAAATYLRGVPFAQVPTTLLAMVDSSVGGKTAVDLPAGKNLAGAFFQPDIVLCGVSALQTLPVDIFQDGCAEMIKHGVILSDELFELLKEPIQQRMEEVICRNVTIKRDIVAADEKETGIRMILNFGHTIGHGIEKHSGYSVTHGKAVAIGMVLASRGASRMGLCGEDCHREIVEAVKRYQLPTETDISPEKLIEAAFFDKKRSGQRITLILPERIGKCGAKSFSLEELAAFIRLAMRA
jgi:3-dehydroquinate synthase